MADVPVDALYDKLQQLGMGDADAARHKLAGMAETELRDLDEDLAEISREFDFPPKRKDIAGFDFWPSGELASSHGGCIEAHCRGRRAEQMARFAAMWADSVHLAPQFGGFHEAEAEDDIRNWLIGSIEVIFAAEPAIRAGVIRLAAPGYRLCPECAPELDAELEGTKNSLNDAIEVVKKSTAGSIGGVFQSNRVLCGVSLKGPKDIFSQGGSWLNVERSPETLGWLPPVIRKRVIAGEKLEYKLSKAVLRRSGVLDRIFGVAASDVLNQHLAAKMRGTSYLTHREIDVALLNAINDNAEFDAWNRVLSQHLQYSFPVLSDVPLDQLLELREREEDSFLVYRDTLKGLIVERLGRGQVSDAEGKDLFDDLVRPELNKMNQRLSAIRARYSSTLRRNVGIVGTTLVLGLTSGLVAPDWAAVASMISGVPFAQKVAATALERGDAEDELRSENLYFLWKAADWAHRD